MKAETLDQKLEVIGTLKGYLDEIQGKGIRGVEINKSFILGYEQCMEDIQVLLWEELPSIFDK